MSNSKNIKMVGVKTYGDFVRRRTINGSTKNYNAQHSLNCNGDVTVKNCKFDQSGYNCLEIGLSNTAPSNVTISKCDFTHNGTGESDSNGARLTNNAILVFAQQEGAVVEISDCYFKSVSNVLRISNRTNTSAKYVLENVTIDEWEPRQNGYVQPSGAVWSGYDYVATGWAGAILLEDYTSKDGSFENRFSNIEIEIKNMMIPSFDENGVATGSHQKLTAEYVEKHCFGNKADNFICMSIDNMEYNGIGAGDAQPICEALLENLPTITVDGVAVNWANAIA